MDIEYWDGGLLTHEVDAIEKMEKTFSAEHNQAKNVKLGTFYKEQLDSIKKRFIFPWKGYAGFRFVDKGYEGEFDLVIVTHCNVLIIELKHWNNGKVTSDGDKWFYNGQDRGRSPVSVTRNKKFLLEKKLKAYKNEFSNKGRLPFVHFLVVMTGNARFDELHENQLAHTISLKDFLQLKNEHQFNAKYRPHSGSKVLNQDFHIFDKLFDQKNTTNKHIIINGYKAIDEIFAHPNGVYKEFYSISESPGRDEALLRLWDFNQIQEKKFKTAEGRFEFVSRERDVLRDIKHRNYDLYKYCLTSLTNVQKDDVTAQYPELYELPPGHVRFNEFIGKFGVSLPEVDRIKVVKLLFAKFADLHEIKIAHRDLSDHSIWISPSKEIALSNFISAYYQPLGTVGDYREVLSANNGLTPFGMTVNKQTTPFHIDVYSLAVLAWHLLRGDRISPNSLKDYKSQIEKSTHWYSPILKQALNQNIANGRDLFDRFKQSEPKLVHDLDFDVTALEQFKHDINLTRQYPEDSFLLEKSDKEVYFSNGLIIKAWLNVNPINNNHELGNKTLHFLEQIAKIKSLSPPYLPHIHEFGIASKSHCLFLVTDAVDGKKWRELTPGINQLSLIEKLISAVQHLHGAQISHGDLHPDNVMVDTINERVWLIDIPDFTSENEESKNHRYSPENIDACSPTERDNFAVIRMSAELLGLDWGEESVEYPSIKKAIDIELEDLEYGFKSLDRFKEVIKAPNEKDTFDFVEITIRGEFEDLEIYPDNGKLYLDILKDNKNPNDLKIVFKGIGGHVSLIYTPFQEQFTFGLQPLRRSTVSRRDIDVAKLELPFGLRIKSGQYPNLNELNRRLRGNEELNRAIDLVLAPSVEELNEDLSQLTEPDKNQRLIEQKVQNNITTRKLWKSIIETETESHPSIELIEVLEPKEQKHQLILSYKADIDPLASFTKTDIIEALLIENDKEHKLGEVQLELSNLREVRLYKTTFKSKRLDENAIIYFRSKQDKASFNKRKNALLKILEQESTICQLADYFEPNAKMKATCYNIEVSDEEFKRYDRKDDHGNKISLNDQQRSAFQKLVNYGPLSLLQGPPGTGKTEFIAAFVHYLVEKQQVNNILLVSQSHEAVNTAAERIRKHCLRLKTPLDVVRFSNREGAVSDGLKDVYSNAIVTEKRELFAAETTYRTTSLSQALGLQPEYLAAVTELELKLFKQIDELIDFTNLQQKNSNKDDEKGLEKSQQELYQTVASSLLNEFDINISEVKLDKLKDTVYHKLQTEYSIRPDETKKALALAKISRDLLDVLATDNVNYDEFFARSRQLVTGTCVGIGQHHIGISDNQYDWVIIDEAARSIASELAIAMQAGKRILLVGDHEQLPPLYTEPHKKALARKLGLVSKDSTDLLQSDFARAFDSLYGKQTGAKLLTQYRMAKPIGELVSNCFYKGELVSGKRNIPDIYSKVPQALSHIVTWLDTASLGKASHHRSDRGSSIYNRAEADEIIALLKEIADNEDFMDGLVSTVKEGEPAIGIICMYAEQKRLIRQKFKEQVWEDNFKSLVKIDTVDSYQGKENRIVILSITRSCPKLSTGFLYLPNRINVALSRAMDRLLIVGASQMWQGMNKGTPLGEVFEFIENQSKQHNKDYQILKVANKQNKGVRK
ncbi:AAA family ATPase [Thalassomonas viridans]|uniref:AAA family ATPase n=1 Tax=Thalassomonas viridans TaxID=137584 RepID=A0AAE9Z0N1_9GAMM|nr:AAA domain-containing protein [Thalassomonas viridans]WDE03864.1 AAA family ATPase [Thalassomonas viridans]